MFEHCGAVEGLQQVLRLVSGSDLSGTGSPDLIDVMSLAEDVKNALAGLQAHAAATFDAAERASRAARGWDETRQGRGLGQQVGLARRESGWWGQVHLGLATVLTRELPHTYAALRAGRISEHRAIVIARETACLTLAHRQLIDEELAGTTDRVDALVSLSDRQTLGMVAARAAVLDPASVVERRRRAESERRVSIRPAPDAMCWLTGLLPVKDGVAAYAAMKQAAGTAHAAGDPRSKGQVMADTLTERLTGRSSTEPAKVVINVVLPDTALLGTCFSSDGDGRPDARFDADRLAETVGAWLDGYGPIPADLVREWAGQATTALRRLYADPAGRLVAMESDQRRFPPALKQLIRLRDQGICRMPWCDAPIAEIDHVTPWTDGGTTAYDNGQGLCQAHNLARLAGWTGVVNLETGEITTITPTGHTYASPEEPARPPEPMGSGTDPPPPTQIIDTQSGPPEPAPRT